MIPPFSTPSDAVWDGILDPLDRRFAEALGRLDPSADPLTLLLAAAASHALQRGDICLDLGLVAEVLRAPERPLSAQPPPRLPPPDVVAAHLASSPLVSSGERRTPLVLRDGRLYLHKYFDYQLRFADGIRRRAARALPMDRSKLGDTLDQLFGDDADAAHRAAAEMVAGQSLAIITGGPGTGKTTTVLRILATLLSLDRGLGIALAAPTGKAAARMGEAITEGLDALSLPPDIAARIPTRASTIHRLLLSTQRHGARTGPPVPLAADVVVVDEASMVDLALMTELAEVVRPEARLVLLGDKDQLASVQAGRVLVDLVAAAGDGGPLAGHVVQFSRTYRFQGAIGELAAAVRAGDADAALDLLRSGGDGTVEWLDLAPDGIIDLATRAWGDVVASAEEPRTALMRLGEFQVLAAHRRGPFGAGPLAAAIRQRLAEDGHIHRGNPWDEWFHGRAVLVTANDPALRLANGDVGVHLIGDDGTRRVHFPGETPGTTRSLGIGQLPPHEPWWATTIHKAQGSGFDHVVVVLPNEPTPLCTRELLYTAVTRARKRVTVISSEASLIHAVRTPTVRASGLTRALFAVAADRAGAPPPRR